MAKLRMSWPNRITLARILLIVPFVIALLRMNDPRYAFWARYAALGLFVAMTLSDIMDGWLARRNNGITSLGTFLDPMADKLLITCACLLLASEKASVAGMKLPDVVVVFIIGKDLYITLGFVIIYMITSQMKIVPVRMGKISTMLQMATVLAILVWPDVSGIWLGFKYLVKTLWWSTVAAAVITVVIYTRNGTRYLNEYEQRKKNDNRV